MAFGVYDWIIFAVFLSSGILVSTWINRSSGKQTSTDFMTAGKSLTWFPVSVSLFASFTSAITLISTPATTYAGNSDYFWIVLPMLFGAAMSAHSFFRLFYKLGISSVYDYLALRFGNDVIKRTVSGIWICYALVTMGIFLYAPSLSFSVAVGEGQTWIFVLASGLISMIFCSIGGLKAVVWIDVLQASVMLIVQIVILIKSTTEAGGIAYVWDYNVNKSRIVPPSYDKFDIYDSNAFWNMILYSFSIWATNSINQIAMQRTLACKSMRQGQAALYATWPMNVLVISVGCLIGFNLAAIYNDRDFIEDGTLVSNDQILTYYVTNWEGWTGFLGLYSSALYAGAISSVSSSQAALAQVTMDDFVRPLVGFKSEARALLVSRILMVIYGSIAVILAYIASKLGNLLVAVISMGSTFVGPFMGMFLAAVLPYNTLKGSVFGVLCGFVISIWICIGQITYETPESDRPIEGLDKIYATSYLLLSPIGMVVSFTFVNLFSLIDRLLSRNREFYRPRQDIVFSFGRLRRYVEKIDVSVEESYSNKLMIDHQKSAPRE